MVVCSSLYPMIVGKEIFKDICPHNSLSENNATVLRDPLTFNAWCRCDLHSFLLPKVKLTGGP